MNQLADNKKLMDFLLYSYFGCESKDLAREGIQKCAYRAYLDLNRRIEYLYSSNALDNMQSRKASEEDKNIAIKYKEAKKAFIESVCDIILCSADKYECVDGQFGLWHKAKCEEIMGTMNTAIFQDDSLILKSNSFTYGLAQKWVNMTLKYLWLLDMLPNGLSEAELHVPVDSFILEALKETQQFNTEGNKITGSGESYYYNGEAWSAISDPENYKKLQKEIRDIAKEQGISPIQWEGPVWIKVAQNRETRKKEQERK